MNYFSKLICKLLMLPATVSYYAPITKWVRQLGNPSFFLFPACNVKWKIVYKKGLSRVFISKPYAMAVASMRLGSLRQGWKRIYGQKKPSLPEKLEQVLFETQHVCLSPQFIDLPVEWKYKPGETAFAALHEYVSKVAPDFVPSYEAEESQPSAMHKAAEIGVVIPVYNGKQHLEILLPSLFRNTTQPHKFIFVNDCSPDQTVLPWLKEQCADREDCVVLENTENLGFPATVNKGAALCKGHFVILNTDTEVPACWLERLMQPIWEDSQVASVTPFSDAATIFSFPFVGNDVVNQQFRREIGMERINEVLRQVTTDAPYLDAPTGVGFCMAINGDVWRKIGGLDAETFGKGYGEENDWCQRAIKSGYKNVLNPKLFVAHHHGGSFETEKKKQLIAKASELIKKLHPNYFKDVSKFIADDPWKKIRASALMKLLLELKCSHSLYLGFVLGGGSELYQERAIKEELDRGGCSLVLRYDVRRSSFCLEFYYKQYCFKFEHVCKELMLSGIFQKVDKIIINQLYTWNKSQSLDEIADWLIRLKSYYSCSVLYLAHDFYSICPRIFCLDQKNALCGMHHDLDCSNCVGSPKSLRLRNWHQQWQKICDVCDEIRFFSNSAAHTVCNYLNVPEEKIRVVPHESPLRPQPELEIYRDELHISVVGAISAHKGSDVVEKLARILRKKDKNAKIYIVGSFSGNYEPNIFILPPYDKNHLGEILNKIKTTICFFPSVCPETFSYTISELMHVHAPIVSFNIGAQGERVAMYDKGRLVDGISAESAADCILRYYDELKNAEDSEL